MATSLERLNQNQALRRAVNARLREQSLRQVAVPWTKRSSYLCECPDTACEATVELTLDEYESVRSNRLLVVVHPTHVDGVDRVRVRNERFALIELEIGRRPTNNGSNGQRPEPPRVLEAHSPAAGARIGSDELADGTRVISVNGELDLSTTPALEDALARVAGPAGGGLKVVVDLSGCTFIDSTGLGALIAAAKRIGELEASLSLVIADQNVLKVFEVTGLDQIFSIHRTRDSAVGAASAPLANGKSLAGAPG